jgi:hypothetical protein
MQSAKEFKGNKHGKGTKFQTALAILSDEIMQKGR